VKKKQASRGANLLAEDPNGMTALEMARENNHEEIVQVLLAAEDQRRNGTSQSKTTFFTSALPFLSLIIMVYRGLNTP